MSEQLTDYKMDVIQERVKMECSMHADPGVCRMKPCGRCFFVRMTDPEKLSAELHLRISTVKEWLRFIRKMQGRE